MIGWRVWKYLRIAKQAAAAARCLIVCPLRMKRVVLKPGEAQKLEFTVTRGQLASLRPDMRFAVNPGPYSVAIGPNSAQVMEARFEVPALNHDHVRKAGTRVPPVSSKWAKPAASGK